MKQSVDLNFLSYLTKSELIGFESSRVQWPFGTNLKMSETIYKFIICKALIPRTEIGASFTISSLGRKLKPELAS